MVTFKIYSNQGNMDNSTQEATTSVEDSDEDDELRELLAQLFALRVLRQARCPPPVGYVCRLCGRAGHYVNHCELATRSLGLTPYQGAKRSFGNFECPRCKKKWMSSSSYATTASTASSARSTPTRTGSSNCSAKAPVTFNVICSSL